MVRCSIVGCKSDSERKIDGLSFHSFPKDPQIRSLWIKATKRNNWEPNKSSRICCQHFDSSIFMKKGKITLIHPEAVPTEVKLERKVSDILNKYIIGVASLSSSKTVAGPSITIEGPAAAAGPVKVENEEYEDDIDDMLPSMGDQNHIMKFETDELLTTSPVQQLHHTNGSLNHPDIGLGSLSTSGTVAGPSILKIKKLDAAENKTSYMSDEEDVDIKPDVDLLTSSVHLSVKQPTLHNNYDSLNHSVLGVGSICSSKTVAGPSIVKIEEPDCSDNIMPLMSDDDDVEPDVELLTESDQLSINVKQPTVGDQRNYTIQRLQRKLKRTQEISEERLKKLKAQRQKCHRLTKKLASIEAMIAQLI